MAIPKAEESDRISESYVNQLVFCNNQIETLVDQLLSESEISPIIILQGDHGPKPDSLTNWHSLSREDQYRLYMRQLSAYYLPQGGNDLLYNGITPVNTFRVVVNYYFGTNYELLDDRSYWASVWPGEKDVSYADITDIVRDN